MHCCVLLIRLADWTDTLLAELCVVVALRCSSQQRILDTCVLYGRWLAEAYGFVWIALFNSYPYGKVFCSSCCCFGWLFLVYLFVCSNLIFFFQQRSYFLSSFDFKLKLIIQQKETYLLTRELLFQGECLVCGSCSSSLFWRSRSISMDELTSLH